MSRSSDSVQLSPSLVLLLEQLTPSLPNLSALARLHVVFHWLKELLSCAILQPTALYRPPSSSPRAAELPLPQPPNHSPPPFILSESLIKRAAPASSPPAATSLLHVSPAPSTAPLLSAATAATVDVSRSRSASSVSSHSDSSSSFVAAPTDVRQMCELLQLCYIDALSRPLAASRPQRHYHSADMRPAADSNDELSVPPSVAALSLIAFLTCHPHFAPTSSFRSLLSEFVRHCGVLFLLHVAHRMQCLPRALSFIACQALPHVNSACVGFLVTRDHCPLLFTSAAGSHILRTLSHHQQLEIVIMQILAPHAHAAARSFTAATGASQAAVSMLSVMSHLWQFVPSLDSHSLYRLCTLLDPSSNTVSPAAVDSHSRIVMCELFLYALCRLRFKAEQDSSIASHQHSQRQQPQETEEDAEAAEEDEEMTFYSAESLHAALLQHRHSYRVWLILAVLNDLRLYEAAAVVHETAEQWVDALEARLRHIVTRHRRINNSSHQSTEEGDKRTGAAIVCLLQSHVAHVPAGPEQARSLALLIRTWRERQLPVEELEEQLVLHMDELADSLAILAFTCQPHALELTSPPVESVSSHQPVSFSPLLLLHLTRHRLQLLRQSHTAAASVSVGSHTASPRMWHDIRQRLHGKVRRRQMAEVGAVSEMTQLTDYRRDSVVAFTCGHCHFAFDMAEVCIPQLTSSTHTQRQQQQRAAVIARQYERALRDGGAVRLACPTCAGVALTLSGQQQHSQQQSQQWTKHSTIAPDAIAGTETPTTKRELLPAVEDRPMSFIRNTGRA